MYYVIAPSNSDLQHHGILGQKWGKQNGPPYPLDGSDHSSAEKKAGWRSSLRKSHRSTSLRGALARRRNEKIDKSFEKWKKNDDLKKKAIDSGKIANEARMKYESDKKNKENKKAYKEANKQYKKDLRANTTWRKGSIRREVEGDLSRKYMSKARKIENDLKKDPNNTILKKEYNDTLSKHDIYRDRARKAEYVGQARSRQKAMLKASLTMTAASVGTAVAVTAGINLLNGTALQNSPVKVSVRDVNSMQKILKFASFGKSLMY